MNRILLMNALALAVFAPACTDTTTDTADTVDTADTTTDVRDTADAADTTTDVRDTADTADTTTRLPIVSDDFEAADAPDPARWTVTSPNCSGSGTVAIDSAVAHSGSHAVRVDGGGGYCNHVFLATDLAPLGADATVHARFFVRLAQPLGDGHVTFLAMRDTTDGKDLRMGGQAGILMWNRESDDATLPELSPTGIATSRALPTDTWTCIELAVDGAAGTLTTHVDGTLVDGLVIDDTATPDIDRQWLRQAWHPSLTTFALGWESYAGATNTLWLDDVALDTQPIGCTLTAPPSRR